MGDLTENFSWGEMGSNIPENYRDNVKILMNRLQVVRDIVGKPIRITSGYRDPEHNRRVGGRPNSYHTKGMAVDFVVNGQSPRDTQKLLRGWSGGMGCYNGFTHLDIGPKRRWGTNVP